jgi:hypothetical protein
MLQLDFIAGSLPSNHSRLSFAGDEIAADKSKFPFWIRQRNVQFRRI